MSLTVNTDTYITLAEANTILEDFFNTTNWDAASDSDKEKALKQATRNIDNQKLRFARYDFDQSLAFPRDVTMLGRNDQTGVVPNNIKIAQALEAMSVLDDQVSADVDVDMMKKGVVSRSALSTSVTYDKDYAKELRSDEDRPLSKKAKNYLNPYLAKLVSRV